MNRILKSVASPQTSEAIVNTARHSSITLILPAMSATGPRIGWTKANGSANAVERSATAPGSTRNPHAIWGMTGSTQREDKAVTKPMKLSRLRTLVMRNVFAGNRRGMRLPLSISAKVRA